MAKAKDAGRGDDSPQAIWERAVAARGDVYPEWRYVVEAAPKLFERIQLAGGQFHKYAADQGEERLSGPMRELIATPGLCSKTDIRHGANHVRKMYRLGVTNRVIFEAASAFSIATGFSTILNVAQAVMEANNPHYAFGKMPEGGEPKELIRFPELDMGWELKGPEPEILADAPEWQYAAGIDPDFARVAAGWVDYCVLANGEGEGDELLGPGPRELIAAAALSTRGETGMAARHLRRAYAYGMTRAQALDAIMSVLPMTGIASGQVGLKAMRLAEPGRQD